LRPSYKQEEPVKREYASTDKERGKDFFAKWGYCGGLGKERDVWLPPTATVTSFFTTAEEKVGKLKLQKGASRRKARSTPWMGPQN
jgi:hypothetical protein